MNKRVLQTALALIMLTILTMYIARFFFPQAFILVIENDRLVAIGSYIDTHRWAYYPATVGFCFVTYWLFVCAACRKKYLTRKEIWIMVAVIAVSYLLSETAPEMASGIDIVCMLLLCVWLRSDIKDYAFVFSVHSANSLLLICARNVVVNITSYNFAVGLCLAVEAYLWLLFLYLVQNYYERIDIPWENYALLGLEKVKTFTIKRLPKQWQK